MAGKNPEYIGISVLANGGVIQREDGTPIISVSSDGGTTNITGTETILPAEIPLVDGKILIGNVDNVAAAQVMTGAIDMTDAGVTSMNPAYLALATTVLNPLDIKQLKAFPITLVGGTVGFVTEFISAQMFMEYDSAVYVITNAGDDFCIRLNNAAGDIVSGTGEATGFIDQAENMVENMTALNSVISTGANADGAALVIHNKGADEFTMGDSPITVRVWYRMHPTGF